MPERHLNKNLWTYSTFSLFVLLVAGLFQAILPESKDKQVNTSWMQRPTRMIWLWAANSELSISKSLYRFYQPPGWLSKRIGWVLASRECSATWQEWMPVFFLWNVYMWLAPEQAKIPLCPILVRESTSYTDQHRKFVKDSIPVCKIKFRPRPQSINMFLLFI